MSNGLIDVFIKGISGFYTQCPRCLNDILGGDDVYIPVEYDFNILHSEGYILHKPICVKCHEAILFNQKMANYKGTSNVNGDNEQ